MNPEIISTKVYEYSCWLHFQINMSEVHQALPEWEKYDELIESELNSIDDLLQHSEEKINETPKLKQLICSSFISNSISGLNDYSEKMVPILLGFSLANPTLLPINVPIYSAIGVILLKAGIDSFCNEKQNEKENE